MGQNTININKANNNLSPQLTERNKIPRSMPWEVKVMACEKHKHVADFHLIMISLIKDCC
jgi:hypothetical protein